MISAILCALQAAGELLGAGRRLLRQMRRGTVPLDDTEPVPLTHRSVEHIQEQIRSATRHEIPPPPPNSRYD